MITELISVLHSFLILVIAKEFTTVLVVVLLLLFFISFCVAGSEVAFFSLTNKDINLLKSKNLPPYKRILNLLEEPKTLLATMLIANSLANIGIIIIGNFLINEIPNLPATWIKIILKVVILSLSILLFAEVIPKVFASQNNIRFARDVSWLIEGLHVIFRRMASWLVGIFDGIEKKLGLTTQLASLEELNQAIDLTSEEGTSESEKNILKGIIKFGNITVKQVMKTRLDVNGFEFGLSFEDLKKRAEELHYSRLPVYDNTLDEIKGMIHTKDLLPYLNEPTNFNWHPIIRPPYFVHEQKMVEDLLKEFQQKRIHFAIVVDEFGGTSGIITLEDILEEIIGEITDEFDDEEVINKKIDDLNYMFEGKTMLNDVCRIMNLRQNTFDGVKGESDSLAGLLLEASGKIPVTNEVITIGDFEFTVMEVDKNRIKKVKATIKAS